MKRPDWDRPQLRLRDVGSVGHRKESVVPTGRLEQPLEGLRFCQFARIDKHDAVGAVPTAWNDFENRRRIAEPLDEREHDILGVKGNASKKGPEDRIEPMQSMESECGRDRRGSARGVDDYARSITPMSCLGDHAVIDPRKVEKRRLFLK